jgi:hypothetical protein
MRVKTWAAVCAGLLVGGAVAAQPPRVGPKSEPARTEGKAEPSKPADSLAGMLSESRTAVGKARDYTCTFTRQEQRDGSLSGEQVAEMRVRTSPAGVYVRFARPEAIAGMEVAYSAARKGTKMRYRPAGVPGARGFQTLDTDDEKFLAENRHPVTEWTMSAVIDRVAAATAREKTLNNPVEVYASDYKFAGRAVTRYEVLTRRPHALRYAHRMLVYVDKETKLPVRYEAYDQPKNGAAVGELFEAYSFSDLKLNVGLGENAFDY